MSVIGERGYLENAYLSDGYLSGEIDWATGMQVDLSVQLPGNTGMQADLKIGDSAGIGMMTQFGKLMHVHREKYLAASDYGYLENFYLTDKVSGLQGMQVEMFIVDEADDHHEGMQVDLKIDDSDATGMQVEWRVFDEERTGMQVQFLRQMLTGMQASLAIYNITQFRLLKEFSSRGTPALLGNNWSSPQGVAAGDFALANLNTDLLEQRTQSPDGVYALWELRCDTGISNTFVDTIGILEHNFTISAQVQVQASDDPNFLSIKFSYNMVTELVNMYYIAPTLPTIPARYFRFLIQDPTQTQNKLKIGIIVFGSAMILTRKTCFQNPVSFGSKHFKDTLRTEGYTGASNDRATRKILTIDFAQIDVDSGDYRQLRNYFAECKTDLKALIVPRPTRPSMLAVFSKLVQLPEESHFAIEDVGAWYVDMTLDYDEAE
jgi:hypothetical protein